MKKYTHFSRYPLLPAIIVVLLATLSPDTAIALPSPLLKAAAYQPLTIRKINWAGNAVYTQQRLEGLSKWKAGEAYDKSMVFEQSNFLSGEKNIASLYRSNGYFLFWLQVDEIRTEGNQVDLLVRIFEGPQCTIGRIIIKGNKKIATANIVKLVSLTPGEVFNEERVTGSPARISASGLFQDHLRVTPVFNPATQAVDIEYQLTEK